MIYLWKQHDNETHERVFRNNKKIMIYADVYESGKYMSYQWFYVFPRSTSKTSGNRSIVLKMPFDGKKIRPQRPGTCHSSTHRSHPVCIYTIISDIVVANWQSKFGALASWCHFAICRASFHGPIWCFEDAIFMWRIVQSFWNRTGVSATQTAVVKLRGNTKITGNLAASRLHGLLR